MVKLISLIKAMIDVASTLKGDGHDFLKDICIEHFTMTADDEAGFSNIAGPTFVTHECTQPSPAVHVSSTLSSLIADCRLLSAGERIYRPHRRRSLAAVVVALVLLLGGVEPNPGPRSTVTAGRTTSFSLLNARS